MSDSHVPAYMNIENVFEYTVETPIGTGILFENTCGVIRRSVYDQNTDTVLHNCIFPIPIGDKEYPVEVILRNDILFNCGYGKLPLDLENLWDGDNQILGEWYH